MFEIISNNSHQRVDFLPEINKALEAVKTAVVDRSAKIVKLATAILFNT